MTNYKRNITGEFVKSRKLNYSLYFFARDIKNTRADNYLVQEILADLFFNGIKFNDSFLIEILDSEFLETDGVLIGNFSFEIYEILAEELFIDNSELIEDLKFRRY